MKAIVISIIAAAAVGIGIAFPYDIIGDSSPQDVNGKNDRPGLNSSGTDNPVKIGNFEVLPDPDPPDVRDSNLRVEKVAHGLALPTSMVFLDSDDMMILQKDNGRIRLISNGTLLDEPIHDVFVNKVSERGLLGIAVAAEDNGSSRSTVFLYYTEEDDSSGEIRNRVYRYHWSSDGGFVGGKIVLDLPGTPGPNHDGGKLTIGPDGMLYAVIGDLNRNGMLQNYPHGDKPDDTSVIIRVDFSGNTSSISVLSNGDHETNQALAKYYAYGIRNSFGIDFDPVTGILWDTENGPSAYDEINVVRPGFNSGWERVMGPIERSKIAQSELVMFNGSHYRDPVFSWHSSEGITDIEFYNSTALGDKYKNNIFVGDFNNGNLYFFTVNDTRDGLSLDSEKLDGVDLSDMVADTNDERNAVTLGNGFGPITDIETGPDGYLYVLTFGGEIYRIVPSS